MKNLSAIKLFVLPLGLFSSLSDAGSTATWTIYLDSACTQLCPRGTIEACSTTVDETLECNQNSEASMSNVQCFADKITYTNFPNTGTTQGSEGCPDGATSFDNEIAVGECVYFPGPQDTYKKIEADTYNCGSDPATPTASPIAAPTIATAAPSSTTTTQPGICNIMDVLGQTIFFSVAGLCWRLQLYTGGVLEGDGTDPTCSNDESDFISSGVFSISHNANMSDNTVLYTVGERGYSGTFKFKEGAVSKPSVNVVSWDPSAKVYEVELTIPTCSTETICPSMRILPVLG